MLDEIGIKITEALGLNAHGRSKMHALALYPKANPWFHVHSQRIKHMREFLLRHPLFTAILEQDSVLPQGAACLFFESTKFFDWEHLGGSIFSFMSYKFDILTCNLEDIFWCFKQKMENDVSQHTIDKRKQTLNSNINVEASLQQFRHFGYQDTCLLQSIFSFKDNTGAHVKHWAPDKAKCPKCNKPDSWKHRVLECQHVTATCQDVHLVRKLCVPDFTKCWGWVLHHEKHNDFVQYVISLENRPPPFQTGKQCFFIDGTASPPNQSALRLAAGALFNPWSNWTYQFQVVGMSQNSIVAEVSALLHAISCCSEATIYSDCSYVVNTFYKILQDVNFISDSYFYFWNKIKTLLVTKNPNNFVVFKVKSHCLEKGIHMQPVWLTYGNHVVDQLAKLANISRPQELLNLWTSEQNHLTYSLSNSYSRLSHLLATFRAFEVKQQQQQPKPSVNSILTIPTPVRSSQQALVFERMPPLDVTCLEPAFRYGPVWGHVLLQYLLSLQWPSDQHTRTFFPAISFGDLMLDMYFCTGFGPPKMVKTGTANKDFEYILAPRGDCACESLTQAIVTFTDSVYSLCLIYNKEVIPGMKDIGKRKEFARTKHGHRDEILNYKLVPFSPKLQQHTKIINWKRNQLVKLKSASLIGKSPIGCSQGPWVQEVSTDHPFHNHSFSSWYVKHTANNRKLLLTNAVGHRKASDLQSFFIDNG
jgi:hypothetical protein